MRREPWGVAFMRGALIGIPLSTLGWLALWACYELGRAWHR